jgi:hypothetical protein
VLPFVRGAPWRAFLAKYPEVNQLQKRMLHVSSEVHAAGSPREAIRELYRAQCNCAYWHGAFGGVYLAFMRAALWHHLARAEGLVRLDGDRIAQIADLDADSRDEVLLRGRWGAAVVSPHDGVVVELADLSVGANLLAVAARHREAYHLEDENPQEENDEGDMAVAQASSDVDAAALTFDERRLGGTVDLINGKPITETFEWSTDGSAVTCSVRVKGLEVTKTFEATDVGLDCRVSLRAGEPFTGTYSSETATLPLNLGRDTAKDVVEKTARGWSVSQPEGEVGLQVTVSLPGHTSSEPIETASTSLEGLQTMYQGTIVTTTWELNLAAGDVFEIDQVLEPVQQPENRHKKEPGVSA